LTYFVCIQSKFQVDLSKVNFWQCSKADKFVLCVFSQMIKNKTAKLVELRYELLLHPSYSLDLVSCNFFPFLNMKKWLVKKRFVSNVLKIYLFCVQDFRWLCNHVLICGAVRFFKHGEFCITLLISCKEGNFVESIYIANADITTRFSSFFQRIRFVGP